MARPLGRYQYYPEADAPKLPKDSAADAVPDADEVERVPAPKPPAPKKD